MTYRALLLGFSVRRGADHVRRPRRRRLEDVALDRASRRCAACRCCASQAARGRLPAQRRRRRRPTAARFIGCGARTPRDRRGRGRSRRRSPCRRIAAWSYAERPQLDGTPRQWYRTSAPQVLVPVEHSGNLGDLRARGRRAGRGGEAADDGRRPRARARQRAGRHAPRARPGAVRAASSATAVDEAVHDPRRHAPPGARARPGAVRLAVRERARADASSPARRSRSAMAGKRRRHASAQRRVRARSEAARRPHDRAADRAATAPATARSMTRTVAVDRTSPRVHVDRVPAVLGSAHPTLRGSIDDASPVALQALLDGASVALRAPDGSALLGHEATSGRFSLPLQHLAQGVHTLSITATDAAGNTSTASRRPVHRRLDREAAQLQRALARRPRRRRRAARAPAQGLRHSTTGRSRASTTRAPRLPCSTFQRAHDLPVTGIATPEVLQLSAERIVVHLNRFRVFLIRDGKRVFSAPIAIGQPALPDADRPLRDHRQDQESDLGAAELALGGRARADSAGREQPARHALDRHERAQHRLPRDAAGLRASATRPRTAACACTAPTSSGSTI